MKAWAEESDLAAMVVTRGGDAAGWINLKHVRPHQMLLVWLWVRFAATFRPPIDVLYVGDLVGLAASDDHQTSDA